MTIIKTPSRRAILGGMVGGLAASALVPAPQARAQSSTPSSPMRVIASFSILADFVRQVGGARVAVRSLVPAGGDAHVYTPTPADARMLAEARLVIVNGLGFEGWVNRLIRSSGTKAAIITASSGVRPLKAEGGGHSHGHSHGHAHGENDPHAWQSVANVKLYVAAIAAGLIGADPDGRAAYEAAAAAYQAELDALDAEIKSGVARIPADRRKIITSHDAFHYFERAYGVDFISPRGVSTAAEPSPQAVARIIRQIKAERIAAVFLENVTDQRLMRRIAEETGARIGGTLYSDALTAADGPAPTYVAMMRHNLKQITGALASS
jgi:zinc/manganese transport system substrate-binding protein